jgi:hypothetical protein
LKEFERAVAAATATGGDSQSKGELLKGACATLRTFANLVLGHGVTDADVQGVSLPEQESLSSKLAQEGKSSFRSQR